MSEMIKEKQLKPFVKFIFNKSTFEQYEPSSITVELSFINHYSADNADIDDYDKLRFLKICNDKLQNMLIDLKVKIQSKGL